jgi:CheY-like chemotaxis protein
MREALHVLAVDDDPDTADSLALALSLHGHEVRVAYNGPAALAAVQARPPDVVLLDLAMPGLDGYELARRLRRQPGMGDALLVCISGYGSDGHRERSRAAGCDHHLLKPVEVADILRLLTPRDGAASRDGCGSLPGP